MCDDQALSGAARNMQVFELSCEQQNLGHEVSLWYYGTDTVCLDDHYTVAQLRIIATALEHTILVRYRENG